MEANAMSLPRNLDTLEALEQAICTYGGDLKRSANSLGINLYDLVQWMNADSEVASTIKAAQLIGWASLESEAYRRAVEGVTEDIYYKGEVCGEKTVYSDGLLQTLLKARVPGYQSEDAHGHGVTVNVAIMPRANNYEEWLEHKERALLPSPEPVEGEYTVVGLPDVL